MGTSVDQSFAVRLPLFYTVPSHLLSVLELSISYNMSTTHNHPLRLNAFRVIIDPQEFDLFKRDMADNKQLKPL
jgi:hypothetical protein